MHTLMHPFEKSAVKIIYSRLNSASPNWLETVTRTRRNQTTRRASGHRGGPDASHVTARPHAHFYTKYSWGTWCFHTTWTTGRGRGRENRVTKRRRNRATGRERREKGTGRDSKLRQDMRAQRWIPITHGCLLTPFCRSSFPVGAAAILGRSYLR